MIDSIINAKIKDNISMSVPLYLMMSYAYYEEDKPIASDSTFDKVSKLMLENWKKIKHPHKKLINLDNLKIIPLMRVTYLTHIDIVQKN